MISLIKASMIEGMQLFNINTKNKSKYIKIFLPIVIYLLLFFTFYSYSKMLMDRLYPLNLGFITLTIFIMLTSFLTIIEGIYKSSSLLFNCRDDDLLLSLPIKKNTILFIRLFKFYVFELIYNSLFLVPAILNYSITVKPGITFYLVSVVGIFMFPIIPIVFSSIIGMLITFISANFRGKSYVQTIITMLLLLFILYYTYDSDKLLTNISENAHSINDIITKLYYPAGIYISLISEFDIFRFLEFITVHIGLVIIMIIISSKFYFKINSLVKTVKVFDKKRDYVIKSNCVIISLVKKEFSRFVNSSVFITNAGFGLLLHIFACILLIIKFDTIAGIIMSIDSSIDMNYIKENISIVLFILICFASFMTSITSSMISLEGKSFDVLKSLPVSSFTLIISKILTAVIIMIPCLLIGDLLVFIKFRLNIISIILLIIASILLPILSQMIGIIVNLRYPKMEWNSDTEVVKQSISSNISVFIGISILALTIYSLVKLINYNLNPNIMILLYLIIFGLVFTILTIYLVKNGTKLFKSIVV